ncbi:putative P-loop containing nucleoside triphosphate hydrolase protein [Lyophyllum shimeji]|uniref:P-loop containing nucleoside triphosphate hydrolase protein n=1 Tax=Lyophyllum shimeji TaxID=47721 RepID=A0A9P3UNR0_LYOSH|nr:putative P-loop containing nucleoside triphosphate hydrolase protein [Lyophyllum shimeji]
MVKRATVESDSDDGESFHADSQKRVRTADSDDDEDLETPSVNTNGGSKKGKGKARARFAENGEEAEDPEAEDQQFEEQHREKILADIASKQKVQGGIAEYGIIERIELVNFMCHKYLTFDFGPQINFIIGHNGSGKSAVLSAITVALGGKSTSTGRGSGLKSFIKEGCSAAEVTITIKNQGDEAYKPKEYGKSVIITRRFTKEGHSSWSIRGVKSNKVISNKKEELSAICDHMNIQVDNPLNVLTQDSARQFLSASHPADKYKFFLRGTQLSQLSDEYNTCLANIQQTYKVLAQKKEAIPDLRLAFKDATIRFEEAAKAREQKQKADELKKELAWAHVRGKEEEMEAKILEVANLEARLPKIQKSIDDANAKFQAATEEVKKWESEAAAFGELDDLNKEKDRLQGLIRANKNTIADFNADMRKIDQSVNSIAKQIEELDAKIEAETQRMAANTQAKHDEMQRKLEAARNALNEAQSTVEALSREMAEQQEKTDNMKKAGEAANKELEKVKGDIQNCQGMIQRAKEAEKNSLIPYGNNIKTVLDTIKTMSWNGDPPLGPLGLHVKAKDPKTWGELLRLQLSSYLTAFVLTDARDRPQLKKLLEKTGNPRTLIIISEKDLFDYSAGEPPENYLTVLRALEISDPFVLRVLINVARIERQLLARTRAEGEQMLRGLRGGGSTWTADLFAVRVYPEGGSSNTPLKDENNNRPRNDATSLLLTGRDAASEIKHHEAEIKTHEVNYKLALAEYERLRREFAAGRQKLDAWKNQHVAANERFRRAKTALANVQQEANDDMPTNITSFIAAKEEAEAEKANVIEQFKDVVRQKQEYDDKNKQLIPELDRVKARINEYNQQKSAIVSKVQDAVEKRLQAEQSRDHYTAKLNAEKATIKTAQAVADVLQEEFTNWTNKALEYCERVPNPRTADKVKRHLESVQRALQEREKRHGATVEEMTIEVNKAKAKLEAAERDLKQMTHLNKTLRSSLIVRLQRWQEFRRHIALRCKLVFGYHLSHRGYYGKVLFNHEAGTLILKVQTDDQAGTQSREKDPRCLDEFDVFMDAVNRRIAMKMMIDTANSSDKKQYILITPQDMGNVQLGKTVKVNRMTDPERAQTQAA